MAGVVFIAPRVLLRRAAVFVLFAFPAGDADSASLSTRDRRRDS